MKKQIKRNYQKRKEMKSKLFAIAVSTFVIMFAVTSVNYSQDKGTKPPVKTEKQQMVKKNEMQKTDVKQTTGKMEEKKMNESKDI